MLPWSPGGAWSKPYDFMALSNAIKKGKADLATTGGGKLGFMMNGMHNITVADEKRRPRPGELADCRASPLQPYCISSLITFTGALP